jgi:aminoglycoside phosphotransferase (APT) family kinase protein
VTETLAAGRVSRMVRAIRPSWTVQRATAVDGGTDTVYDLVLDTPGGLRECVLKACTGVPPADFRPEPRLLELLARRTDVPGPRVVGFVDGPERTDGRDADDDATADGTAGDRATTGGTDDDRATTDGATAGGTAGDGGTDEGTDDSGPDGHRAGGSVGDLPTPFYLMERCEGVSGDEAALPVGGRARLALAAGRFAADYHRLGEFDLFGRLRVDPPAAGDGSDAGLVVEGERLAPDPGDDGTPSWRAHVEATYREWVGDLDERFGAFEPRLRSFVDARLDALDGVGPARLGHVDYKPWNVLVDPATAETTAVLDWGHATAIDPAYDLYLAEEHLSRWAPLRCPRRRRVRAAVERGYAAAGGPARPARGRRRELYLAVSRLQALVWFAEWHPDATPAEREHIAAEHRRFVRELTGRAEAR